MQWAKLRKNNKWISILIGVLIQCNALRAAEPSTLKLPFINENITNYQGRLTIGGFLSKENFVETETSGGSTRNDFATLSARLFAQTQHFTRFHLTVTADLRDKNDFFDKLNKELYTLTARNDFQPRQLSIEYPNETGYWLAKFGRFQVPEAGAVFADGGLAGIHLTPVLSMSIFGGLNPKKDDESSLAFNSTARIVGGTLIYAPREKAEKLGIFVNSAVTAKQNQGQWDRLFLYHYATFHWPKDHLLSMATVDFIPRAKLQNLYLQHQHSFLTGQRLQLSSSYIDVIEYFRRQSVRETLAPSIYYDLQGSLTTPLLKKFSIGVTPLLGRRASDGLTRREIFLNFKAFQLFAPQLSLTSAFGLRRHFVSSDTVFRAGIDYTSAVWDISLTEELAHENYDLINGAQPVLNPSITELSVNRTINETLYSALSTQYSHDEKVSIVSFFAKLGYRFGNTTPASTATPGDR